MIILASASHTRIALLRNAGIDFASEPAPIDERIVEAPLLAAGRRTAEIAMALAELKALAVAARHPSDLVIGADQVLDLDGERFVKPVDRADATVQIARLAGRIHHLRTAVCLARGSDLLWRHLESPALAMRPLNPAAIARYVERAGDSCLGSVGAYQLEGIGIQLFERIEGDYFSVLGLPMLPLVAALRAFGAISSDEAS